MGHYESWLGSETPSPSFSSFMIQESWEVRILLLWIKMVNDGISGISNSGYMPRFDIRSSKPPGGNYHANVKSLSFQHVISWFVEINVDVPYVFICFHFLFKRVFLVWFVGVFVWCSMHIWSQCEVWPHRWIFGLSCFSHGTVLWIVANNQWGATWYTYIISYIYIYVIYIHSVLFI